LLLPYIAFPLNVHVLAAVSFVLQSSRSLLFTYTIVNAAELTATATVCISTSWPSDTSAYMPLARSDNFTVIALQENTLQVSNCEGEGGKGAAPKCHSRMLLLLCVPAA
jgi:hypothetical protein